MFDSNSETSVAETPVDSLPCLVQLPTGWVEQYAANATPLENDQRRFPRLACGGAQAKAALEYRTTLPGRPREATAWGIYPVSVSRGGMAFLHSEQLFPGEKFTVRISAEKTYEVEVARCRRIGPRCFEIGTKF